MPPQPPTTWQPVPLPDRVDVLSDSAKTASMPDFDLVLVVEDDRMMRATLMRLFTHRSAAVLSAASVGEATQLLATHRVSLVILDVRLRNESGIDVAAFATRLIPAPVVVAVSGAASPGEAFALAQQGVRAYIPKAELASRMDELVHIMSAAPPLEPLVKAQVGVRSVRQVQEAVRDTMLDQALALEQGNLAGAAKRLGVTRQAVQQMMRRREKNET